MSMGSTMGQKNVEKLWIILRKGGVEPKYTHTTQRDRRLEPICGQE